MATDEPTIPPAKLQIPTVRPTTHRIEPLIPNTSIDAKLVDTLTTFAIAEAPTKEWPSAATKTIIKRVPVPGPINPS